MYADEKAVEEFRDAHRKWAELTDQYYELMDLKIRGTPVDEDALARLIAELDAAHRDFMRKGDPLMRK